MTIYSGPTGPGQFVQTDPRFQLPPVGGVPPSAGSTGFSFENLLNQLRGAAGKAGTAIGNAVPSIAGLGKYGAAVAPGGAAMAQGDILGGAAQMGAGVVATKLSAPLGQAATTAAAAALPGPLKALAPLAGGLVQGGAGLLAGGATGQAISGAKGLAQTFTGSQREAGQTPGAIPGTTAPGVGDYSDKNMADLERLLRATGQNQVGIAQQMLPITNQFRDSEMQRQMQLNQQVGQLTGALNRQAYIAQLAGGSQQEAGATVRTMMTAANPYAASAFQYRG